MAIGVGTMVIVCQFRKVSNDDGGYGYLMIVVGNSYSSWLLLVDNLVVG